MGRKIGYARPTNSERKLHVQKAALRQDGCEIIYGEAAAQKKRAGDHLRRALAVLSEGDTLVVTRLNRFGKTLSALAVIARKLNAKKATLRVLEHCSDTGIRSQRQVEKIARIFADPDRYLRRNPGPPRRIDRSEVARMKAEGHGPAVIARVLGICTDSVHRILADPDLNRRIYPRGLPRIDRDQVMKMKAEGHDAKTIARTLGISTATVYAISMNANTALE